MREHDWHRDALGIHPRQIVLDDPEKSCSPEATCGAMRLRRAQIACAAHLNRAAPYLFCTLRSIQFRGDPRVYSRKAFAPTDR